MTKSLAKGIFIVFEGLGGSGKTVQSKLLTERFRKEGYKVLWNYEPTPRFWGKIIRGLIHSRPVLPTPEELVYEYQKFPELFEKRHVAGVEAILDRIKQGQPLRELERQLLFICDRLDDLAHTIIPALERGEIVVQDRYDLSTFAHGMAGGLARGLVQTAQEHILGEKYLIPDLLIFIEVTLAVCAKRAEARGDMSLYDSVGKMEKIDHAYQLFLAPGENAYRAGKIVSLPGEGTIEEVGGLVWQEASTFLEQFPTRS